MKGESGNDEGACRKGFCKGREEPARLMTKVEVAMRKDDWNTFLGLGKLNGTPPEIIMRNCLADFAEEIRTGEE